MFFVTAYVTDVARPGQQPLEADALIERAARRATAGRKYSRGCALSDYARRRSVYRRASASIMSDNEGSLTLAGAICILAATQHSKNTAEQEQIGATFYNLAITGFKAFVHRRRSRLSSRT